MEAQRGITDTVTSSINLGCRRMKVGSVTFPPLDPRKKIPLPSEVETEWASKPVWTCLETRKIPLTAIRHPVHSGRKSRR